MGLRGQVLRLKVYLIQAGKSNCDHFEELLLSSESSWLYLSWIHLRWSFSFELALTLCFLTLSASELSFSSSLICTGTTATGVSTGYFSTSFFLFILSANNQSLR
ncbi:hypothetical protein FGO68_gene12416 [Halteria grandinella]|uniref:Uncharacterized protein n=1 Tax=Halteria grandinella TaxID=5974 RepID=A0A8J8STT1_HALGN|nr:hypothetical protein FGO68_gene12416 [Halteria grandinella]